MGLMTGDDVQFLNTRVGATPAAAATHGTAVMRYSRQHRRPRLPLPWGHCHPWAWPPSASTIAPVAPSTTSSAGRPRQTAATSTGLRPRRSQMGGHVRLAAGITRTPPAAARQEHRRPPARAKLAQGSAHGCHHNICLPLMVDNNTTVRVVLILFPQTATFTPIKVSVAAAAAPSSWPAACPCASCYRSETASDPPFTFPG